MWYNINMSISSNIKNRAIALRKKGYTYSEILNQILVAKSTLSEWLHSVNLSKHQQQRLTKKKLASALKGATARHANRITSSNQIKIAAHQEVKHLIRNPLWLLGIGIYWAEGAKEKPWRSSERVSITNMDLKMIKIFILWLEHFAEIKSDTIEYSLYIHKNSNIQSIADYWRQNLKLKQTQLKIYKKPDFGKKFRKNTESYYKGIFRVRVPGSTNLNRKIAGWIDGVIEYLQ